MPVMKQAKVQQGSNLTVAEQQRCRDAFVALDKGTGELPLRHIRSALQRLGVFPAEEDLFQLIMTFDPNGRGVLTIDNLIELVSQYKSMTQNAAPMDTSNIDAFVALGGNRDQSGVISTEKLRDIVMNEFALPINIDKLIEEADTDHSGFIDFEEFSTMLSNVTVPQ